MIAILQLLDGLSKCVTHHSDFSSFDSGLSSILDELVNLETLLRASLEVISRTPKAKENTARVEGSNEGYQGEEGEEGDVGADIWQAIKERHLGYWRDAWGQVVAMRMAIEERLDLKTLFLRVQNSSHEFRSSSRFKAVIQHMSSFENQFRRYQEHGILDYFFDKVYYFDLLHELLPFRNDACHLRNYLQRVLCEYSKKYHEKGEKSESPFKFLERLGDLEIQWDRFPEVKEHIEYSRRVHEFHQFNYEIIPILVEVITLEYLIQNHRISHRYPLIVGNESWLNVHKAPWSSPIDLQFEEVNPRQRHMMTKEINFLNEMKAELVFDSAGVRITQFEIYNASRDIVYSLSIDTRSIRSTLVPLLFQNFKNFFGYRSNSLVLNIHEAIESSVCVRIDMTDKQIQAETLSLSRELLAYLSEQNPLAYCLHQDETSGFIILTTLRQSGDTGILSGAVVGVFENTLTLKTRLPTNYHLHKDFGGSGGHRFAYSPLGLLAYSELDRAFMNIKGIRVFGCEVGPALQVIDSFWVEDFTVLVHVEADRAQELVKVTFSSVLEYTTDQIDLIYYFTRHLREDLTLKIALDKQPGKDKTLYLDLVNSFGDVEYRATLGTMDILINTNKRLLEERQSTIPRMTIIDLGAMFEKVDETFLRRDEGILDVDEQMEEQ